MFLTFAQLTAAAQKSPTYSVQSVFDAAAYADAMRKRDQRIVRIALGLERA